MSEMLSSIRTMRDVEELRSVISTAKQRIEVLASVTMNVGDRVQMLTEHHGQKPYDNVGVIQKVNPKKFKILFANGYGVWGIPKSMVKLVK